MPKCSINGLRDLLSEEFSGDALDLKVEEFKTWQMAKHKVTSTEEARPVIRVGREVGYRIPQIVEVYKVEKIAVNQYKVHHLTDKLGKEGFTLVNRKGQSIGKGKSWYPAATMKKLIAELGIVDNSDIVETIADADMKSKGTDEDAKIYDEAFYTDMGAELVKNPKKAVEFARELDALDDVNISDSHRENLVKVLETFLAKGNKFIPEMHVYLNTLAEENGGVIEFQGEDRGIYLNAARGAKQKAGNQMGSMETFTHEIIHAATEYALHTNKAEIAPLVARLRKLQSDTMKEMTVEDLLPKHSPLSEEAEMAIAKKRLSYLRSKDGLSEFITLGLTNEQVMAKLETIMVYKKREAAKGFFGALLEMIKMLFESVMQMRRHETKDTRGNELLANLSFEIAKANNTAIRAHKRGIVAMTSDLIDRINKPISDMIRSIEARAEKKAFPKLKANATKWDRAIWTFKNAWRLLIDDRTRTHMENVLSVMGMTQEGTVQTEIRNLMKTDSLQRIVERMGLARGQLDRLREDRNQFTLVALREGFKEKPTRDQDEAIKLAILDTDLASIFDDYSIEEVIELMSKGPKLTVEINNIIGQLRAKHEKGDANYYIHQAKGLGHYMATHQAGIAQLLNAKNIARKMNDLEIVEADAETVAMIDKLATLEALIRTKRDSKTQIAEMLESDPDGIRNLVAYHQMFKRESEANLFAGSEVNVIKGYMREAFDDDITLKIAPLKEKAELEKFGYELVEELGQSESDVLSEQRGLFINKDNLVQGYNQGAMRLTDETRKGTTLSEIHGMSGEIASHRRAEVSIRKARRAMMEEIEKQRAGTAVLSEAGNELVPVLAESGVVRDFRYMMSKDMKVSLLKMETRGTAALARSRASVVDKAQTMDFNKEVLKVIYADMEENYEGRQYGKNQKEYIVIEEDSPKKEIRELWKILPSAVKHDVEKRKLAGKPGLAVRRDLLFPYFGFRDATVANMWGVKSIDSKMIKHWIRAIEHMWQEIIKIAKVNIIIKMPMTLLGNIMSNFIAPIQFGMSPWASVKMQYQGAVELTEFQKNYKELEILKAAKASGNVKNLDITRIEMLEGWMEQSSAKKLMDAGLFQAIIEDANIEDMKTSSAVTKKADKMLENAPAFIRNGLNYLYLTEKTAPFKMMTKFTQYSDFIARYALYHGYMKKLGATRDAVNAGKMEEGVYNGMEMVKGTSQADLESFVIQRVTDVFINYSIPSSKMVEYANKAGFVMFTKYFQRIQRVLRDSAVDHPVNFMMALAAQEYIIDAADITDQSIFSKDLSYMFHSPLEHVGTVFTPPLGALISEIL